MQKKENNKRTSFSKGPKSSEQRKTGRPGKKTYVKITSEKSDNERVPSGKRIGKSRINVNEKPEKNTKTSKSFANSSTDKLGTKSFVKTGKNKLQKKSFSPHNNEATLFKPRKNDDKIRLNRYLSNSGVCSRREADTYIETGCVTVNGKIVTELGTRVSISDEVKFSGQVLNPQKKVYLLLNKPKGYVTTTDDPQQRKTVMDLVQNACKERFYPVGRLDLNTSGVLLFTNDGELSKKLTHPSHNIKKIYHVVLDKPLTKNHLLEIARGIDLDDGRIAADAIDYADEENKREIGIEIHSGRNRIVRRIFEHFGYNIEKLDRVFFAGLTKKNLPRGKWRFLTQIEINQLKMV